MQLKARLGLMMKAVMTSLLIITLFSSCTQDERNSTAIFSDLNNQSAKHDYTINADMPAPYDGKIVPIGRYYYLLRCESYIESHGIYVGN